MGKHNFFLYFLVCNLTASGVAAIFGPSDIASAGIVKSIAETLEIPNLQTQWEVARDKLSLLTIKTYPETKILSQVWWKTVHTYILSNMDGYGSRMSAILQTPNSWFNAFAEY